MDKIANIISSIENAQRRHKTLCSLPFSNKTLNILQVLFIEGYIKGFKVILDKTNAAGRSLYLGAGSEIAKGSSNPDLKSAGQIKADRKSAGLRPVRETILWRTSVLGGRLWMPKAAEEQSWRPTAAVAQTGGQALGREAPTQMEVPSFARSGKVAQNVQNSIQVYLKYGPEGDHQNFFKIKRVSKPGKKIYLPASAKGARRTNINKIKRGLGILLLSTSKGILCDRDARYLSIGGEALCTLS